MSKADKVTAVMVVIFCLAVAFFAPRRDLPKCIGPVETLFGICIR